jgi:hypothetical protein
LRWNAQSRPDFRSTEATPKCLPPYKTRSPAVARARRTATQDKCNDPAASWLRLCRGLHRVRKEYHIFGSRIVPFVTPKRAALMSALGQKQTFALQWATSALPPKADMCGATRDVRFGPLTDSCTAAIVRATIAVIANFRQQLVRAFRHVWRVGSDGSATLSAIHLTLQDMMLHILDRRSA